MKRYGLFAGSIVLVFGLLWSSLAFAECRVGKRCLKSLVLSKSTSAEKPECFEKYDCLTETEGACDDCIMRIQWEAEIKSNGTDCDELKDLIPDGSMLRVDLLYHMRTNGPCQTPVGTHAGRFKIEDSAGNLIATGRMKGTNGLETHASSGNCCEAYHDEGSMDGRFAKNIAREIKCRKFTATYSSSIDPTSDKVCEEDYWRHWNLNIEGIALCKCPRPEKEDDGDDQQ